MTENINIQLPVGHIPQIRDFYLARLKDLENQVSDIRILLSQFDNQGISTFSPNGQLSILQSSGSSINGYNPKWSLIKQAKFVLTITGKAMTSREIVEYIIDNYNSGLRDDRKRFMSSMSGTLSGKSKEGGVFKREQNDSDEFEYTIA